MERENVAPVSASSCSPTLVQTMRPSALLTNVNWCRLSAAVMSKTCGAEPV